MSIVAFGLVVLVTLLAIAALSVPVARKIGMPVTVVFAGVGVLHGVVTSIFGLQVYGGVLDSYDSWFVAQLALDSQSLLYLFLPPLLFEMALAVNVRRLFDDIVVVLVMAIFAVVAATLVIGGGLWAVTSFSLIACLMLGAVVATTDPGAVISTFREIGAPRRLLVILEGESLLNDAAAIAIFALLLSVLRAEIDPTLSGFLLKFCYSFGVGALIGLGVALLASAAYPLLARSSVAEASLTVVVAYGAFLITEQLAGASGVVAVVFAGLATGSTGFLYMGPGNWATVRTVWNQIGFWSNGLIMILAASLVPGLIAEQGWIITPLVALIYFGAGLARALIIYGVLPVLARLRLSAPILPKQNLLIIWGGVRGSVTLLLAITLADLSALGEGARLLGALAASYTLCTIFLNATTLAWLTRRLGLNHLSPADLALRDQIVAGALERVRNVVQNVMRARDIEPEALDAVEQALGARKTETLEHAEQQASGERIPFGERLKIGLTIACGQEARLIRRAFEEGAIGPRAAGALRLDAERMADAARVGGREAYSAAALDATGPSWRYRTAVTLQRRLRIERPLRSSIEIQFGKLLESERIVRELRVFIEKTVTPMIGEDASQNLSALMNWRHTEINTQIDAIASQYPNYALDLEKTLITRTAIRRERQQYLKLMNDSVISPEVHDDLISNLDERERVAARPPRLDLTLTPAALLDRIPLFADLDERQRKLLAKALRTRFTSPGEVIYKSRERGTAMYFIASGAFELVHGDDQVQHLKTGDYFGGASLIHPLRRRDHSAISQGYCRVLLLGDRVFAALSQKDPAVGALIRRLASHQPDPSGPAHAGGLSA